VQTISLYRQGYLLIQQEHYTKMSAMHEPDLFTKSWEKMAIFDPQRDQGHIFPGENTAGKRNVGPEQLQICGV
jgi:hypothetical protein